MTSSPARKFPPAWPASLRQSASRRQVGRLAAFMMVALAFQSFGQETPAPADLKKLSIEELMNLEVTSVSRRSEKLVETPSAIQVVTGDDIRSFGATNIPEALYLAGNLHVVQKGSHSWGVSARGFNTDLANKLLVLSDGRTVYTPLFSGVFWDRQDYLLEDINQIEVISGPGGTLWGANAVNGVINMTSKHARETQGLFTEGAAGNELKTLGSARYGGKLGHNMYYRVYGRCADRDNAVYPDSVDVNDDWRTQQAGFRMDTEKIGNNNFTLQGDLYYTHGGLAARGTSHVTGGNALGRWTRTFSGTSEMRLQAYYDETRLTNETPPFVLLGIEFAPGGIFKDHLTTYDVDFQHRFQAGFNHIVWGAGYRFTRDSVTNSPGLAFFPTLLEQSLYSVFLQDEISLFNNKLGIIAGTKLEHNAYTGYVLEPNVRAKWNLSENSLLWAAASRAVRTPSRVDRHISQNAPPYFQLLVGGPKFDNEVVVSYELGYRQQIAEKATTSLSLYYSVYDQLRSTEPAPTSGPIPPFPFVFANNLEAEIYGAELSVTAAVTDWWHLFTSLNFLHNDVRVKAGQTDLNNALNESADPGAQFTFRSSFLLPGGVTINPAFRWVDKLKINDVGMAKTAPSYAEVDGQISWQASKSIQLSVAGRNLLHDNHFEYGIPRPGQVEIQRSVYGKISLRF